VEANIIIKKRFCGPPQSGNGGYVCGRLAKFIPGPAEVRLKSPPPLETPLKFSKTEEGHVLLHDGNRLIAEARPTHLDFDVPPPPNMAEALSASKNYAGYQSHPFPTCFVCGPQRHPGDGLNIFPGPLKKTHQVTAPWVPDASLCNNTGKISPEFIWAALDCPGAFAAIDGPLPKIVLGTLSAEIVQGLKPGEPCIVVGWKIAQEGRKFISGTALYNSSSKWIARAKATWISLEKP